jgi:hypothetical protein
MNRQPIAYTFEADYHCEACTRARFPTTEGTDCEGNPVGAVFPWDEWGDPEDEREQWLTCGTCHGVIDHCDALNDPSDFPPLDVDAPTRQDVLPAGQLALF